MVFRKCLKIELYAREETEPPEFFAVIKKPKSSFSIETGQARLRCVLEIRVSYNVSFSSAKLKVNFIESKMSRLIPMENQKFFGSKNYKL